MASLHSVLDAETAFVDNVSRLDADTAWAAFERRDRSWDGRVIGAVKTTGIYCKPSCPARRPKREHVEFFMTGESARAAGYRPCLRCRPDEVGRDREAVARAVKLIEQAEEPPRWTTWPMRSATRRIISSGSSRATLASHRRNMPADSDPARRSGARRERTSDRRDLRRRLFGPEPFL